MIFKKAYALAQEMLRDSGHRADPLSNFELTRLHQVEKRGGGGGAGGGGGGIVQPFQPRDKIPTRPNQARTCALPTTLKRDAQKDWKQASVQEDTASEGERSSSMFVQIMTSSLKSFVLNITLEIQITKSNLMFTICFYAHMHHAAIWETVVFYAIGVG